MPVRKRSALSIARRLCQLAGWALLAYGLWMAPKAGEALIPPDLLLRLDPLVGMTAAIASRTLVITLAFTAATLLGAVLLGRVFCGWLCPLGGVIDLFDFLLFRRLPTWIRPGRLGKVRFLVLGAVLAAAAFGLILTPFVAPLPMLNRALALGWVQALPGTDTHLPASNAWRVSAIMAGAAILLSLIATRFWCRVLCPSGALLGLAGRLGLRRRVNDACIACGKCARECPAGAISPQDFASRPTECILCLKCRDICPVDAISFGYLRVGPPKAVSPRRRAAIAAVGVGIASAIGGVPGVLLGRRAYSRERFLRPPGAQDEDEFLAKCIGCAECIRACPTNALQMARSEGGLEQFWTPRFSMRTGGCLQECNNCGQVCPTGAIPALPLDDKQSQIIGVARVQRRTCLPWHHDMPCNYCETICPYNAIVSQWSTPGGRRLTYPAPQVDPSRCNGCGLCEHECYRHNVLRDGLMDEPAIAVRHSNELGNRGAGRRQGAGGGGSGGRGRWGRRGRRD